jgi:hypothetical protein
VVTGARVRPSAFFGRSLQRQTSHQNSGKKTPTAEPCEENLNQNHAPDSDQQFHHAHRLAPLLSEKAVEAQKRTLGLGKLEQPVCYAADERMEISRLGVLVADSRGHRRDRRRGAVDERRPVVHLGEVTGPRPRGVL